LFITVQFTVYCSLSLILATRAFRILQKIDIKVEISDELLFLDSEMNGDYPDIPPPSYEDVIKGNYFGSSTEARRNDGEIVPSADGSYARVPMFSRQITDSRTLEMRGSLPVQQFLLSRGTDIPQNQICEAIQQSDDQEGPSQLCLFCALLLCLPVGFCAVPWYIMARRSHESGSPEYPSQKSTFYCTAYFAILLGVTIVVPKLIEHFHPSGP